MRRRPAFRAIDALKRKYTHSKLHDVRLKSVNFRSR